MREMKDSGVPWIGEIPEVWGRTTLYNVLRGRITDGPHETPTLVDEGIPFISIDSLGRGDQIDFSVVKKFISEEDYRRYSKKTVLEKGDILFTKAATIGKTAIVGDKERFMVWSPLAIIKVDETKARNRFIYYLLNCEQLVTSVKLIGSMNTQINVGMRELEKTQITIPPLNEQQRIADFLDAKCAEIDSILESTRASIEEYKKLKQSVITEAVTKGIRGKRPMKDSGVEWIGEIPTVWKVCRIKHVLTPGKEGIKIGPFGSALTNNVKGEGPFKIYGQWNIVNKDFSAGKNYVSEETFEALGSYMVYTGDVLISMMGTIGKCAIIPHGIQPGIMDSHVIKARLNRSLILDRYFELVFDKDNSAIIFEQMQKGKKGSIMDGLNSSIVKNLVIPCPPIVEQQEIAAYLDEKCSDIDSLIASKESLITELEAYKKSIIYEYVTGKKEV